MGVGNFLLEILQQLTRGEYLQFFTTVIKDFKAIEKNSENFSENDKNIIYTYHLQRYIIENVLFGFDIDALSVEVKILSYTRRSAFVFTALPYTRKNQLD